MNTDSAAHASTTAHLRVGAAIPITAAARHIGGSSDYRYRTTTDFVDSGAIPRSVDLYTAPDTRPMTGQW
ncbi:hypothetical protein [Nocardia sp. NPDC005366]|uniref:hypothetical protein n=1 Tax=Nocardia sp. NPDC005366 TaxID=3156878 RepID=UPI0033B832CA